LLGVIGSREALEVATGDLNLVFNTFLFNVRVFGKETALPGIVLH